MTRLLKLREVAEQLGVSLSTVERLVASGAFAQGVIRFGGNTRIAAEAVASFVGAHADVSNSVANEGGQIPKSGECRITRRETTAADAIARTRGSGPS